MVLVISGVSKVLITARARVKRQQEKNYANLSLFPDVT